MYGLKRIRSQDGAPIGLYERSTSLIQLGVIPWIREWATQASDACRLRLAEGVSIGAWRTLLCRAHSLAESILGCLSIVQTVRYASTPSDHHQTPLLSAAGVKLTYHPDISESRVRIAFELLAFALQLSTSWRAEDAGRRAVALPSPPAPAYHPRAETLRGLCPLCLQKWSVPTVVNVSGFVYCFRCIMRHLQSNEHCCPVTRLPANVSNLVRLHVSA